MTSPFSRFILQFAAMKGGVVVSNDAYDDLLREHSAVDDVIRRRRLPFTFIGDLFMVPDDPVGRSGPKLQQFLSF